MFDLVERLLAMQNVHTIGLFSKPLKPEFTNMNYKHIDAEKWYVQIVRGDIRNPDRHYFVKLSQGRSYISKGNDIIKAV